MNPSLQPSLVSRERADWLVKQFSVLAAVAIVVYGGYRLIWVPESNRITQREQTWAETTNSLKSISEANARTAQFLDLTMQRAERILEHN